MSEEENQEKENQTQENENSTQEVDALLANVETSEPQETKEYDKKEDAIDENQEENTDKDTDEYGNPKPEKKMYSEDEVNQRIQEAVRERVARFERNNPDATQQQKREATREIAQDEAQGWQEQLKGFVKQTFVEMNQEQQRETQQRQEQQQKAELESKILSGRGRFKDYDQRLMSAPITDAMLMAAGSADDPAAFLHRATEVAMDDLKRISQIQSPYKQMTEIGKLEDKLRHKKAQTKSPRPGSRVKDDDTMPLKEEKEPTPDDLIRQVESQRLKMINDRRRR